MQRVPCTPTLSGGGKLEGDGAEPLLPGVGAHDADRRRPRSVWSEIDLDTVHANVAALRALATPAQFLAVVKANAYGHGAVPVAGAALRGGRDLARCRPGRRGRRSSARSGRRHGRSCCCRSRRRPRRGRRGRRARSHACRLHRGRHRHAREVGGRIGTGARPLAVHLKVDTGMHRVGCTPADACRARSPGCPRATSSRLAGVCAHLALADEPGDPYTREQLERFAAVLEKTRRNAGLRPTARPRRELGGPGSRAPRARHSLVHVGIAMYGLPPTPRTVGRAPRGRRGARHHPAAGAVAAARG